MTEKTPDCCRMGLRLVKRLKIVHKVILLTAEDKNHISAQCLRWQMLRLKQPGAMEINGRS